MQSKADLPRNNKRPGRKITKSINYHESPPSRELNDSDYEPNQNVESHLAIKGTLVKQGL